MNVGRRLIYDNETGEVVSNLGTMSGDNVTARPVWGGISYIDIPYGQDESLYQRAIKMHIDLTTKNVVFDQLTPVPVDQTYIQRTVFSSVLNLNKLLLQIKEESKTVESFVSSLKNL